MRRGFVGIILVVAMGIVVPSGVFAAPLSSLQIDNSPQFGETVKGPDGVLHTLWVAQHGRSSRLLYQVIDAAGRSIAGPMAIVDSSARIRRPQLAVDQSSLNGERIVHFLWQERVTIQAGHQDTAIRYATLTLEPAGVPSLLSPPVTINQDQTATHPSLAVDHAGWAYAVWEIEGLEVKLAAINPSGHVSQVRRIAREATKSDHALPTVAVDRRGNVHVVWSTQTGNNTQLVYKAFRGHGGQVLEKEKIIYTTNGDVNQTKVLTFDSQGAVKVTWFNSRSRRAGQHGHGRPARLGARIGGGSLVLRHDHSGRVSAVAAVVGQSSLAAVPGPVWSVAGEAVITPKLRLDVPVVGRVSLLPDAIPLRTALSAGGDDAVSKLLMERLLRYATWSAAPPSVREATATRLLTESSVRFTRPRLLDVARSALFPCRSNQIDRFAFQPVPFTQGGDTIA